MVGTCRPSFSAALRIVVPAGTVTASPSMVSVTSAMKNCLWSIGGVMEYWVRKVSLQRSSISLLQLLSLLVKHFRPQSHGAQNRRRRRLAEAAQRGVDHRAAHIG